MAKKQKLFYQVNIYSTTYTDYGAEHEEVLINKKPIYRWAESISALISRLRRRYGYYDRILEKDIGDLGCLRIKYRFEIEEAEYKKPVRKKKNFEVLTIFDTYDPEDW